MVPRSRSSDDSKAPAQLMDFSSDVGRKKFGFSHEAIEGTTSYYEGQFKLYQRHGDGFLHSPDTGSKYSGQFQEDHFHGTGDLTWSDDSRYVGQFRRGQKHGQGEYTSAQELSYVGRWEDGARHGNGEQAYANGDRYVGGWFKGLCSGSGIYYFADGSRYEGGWSNGRYDGKGILYGADGSRERMEYDGGVLMKREALKPVASDSPNRGRHALSIGARAIWSQSREEVIKTQPLAKSQVSPFLIRRETADMDLSAPPLRAKTMPQVTA